MQTSDDNTVRVSHDNEQTKDVNNTSSIKNKLVHGDCREKVNMQPLHANQDRFMQEGNDDLVITSSKGSTLPILDHIKGEDDDGENTVDLRLSNVSFSAL